MFKKSVCLSLIVCQLVLNSAFAADRPNGVTAERQLVETVLTLKGLRLSDQDLQRQVEGSLRDYDGAAPVEGRNERLEQAFVDMRVLSPQQARTFTARARSAEEGLRAQNLPTPEARGEAIAAQLELFARVNPVGAQFNTCGLASVSVGLGGLAIAIGLTIAHDNPTCHSDYGNGYACTRQHCSTCTGSNDIDYDCNCYDYDDTCYPWVCDRPGYHPHERQGNTIAIAGGVAAAVGIVLLFTNQCLWD